MSRFVDALDQDRCVWTITLRDGSKARCGRRHVDGKLCKQHAKMHALWSCEYCGGNDELPPDHCMDCERPQGAPSTPAAAAPAWHVCPDCRRPYLRVHECQATRPQEPKNDLEHHGFTTSGALGQP